MRIRELMFQCKELSCKLHDSRLVVWSCWWVVRNAKSIAQWAIFFD
jgi:hypothetical protein